MQTQELLAAIPARPVPAARAGARRITPPMNTQWSVSGTPAAFSRVDLPAPLPAFLSTYRKLAEGSMPHGLPRIETLDLRRFGHCLSGLTLWEVLPEEDYLCLFAGEAISRHVGIDPAGHRLSEIGGDWLAAVLAEFDLVRTQRVAHAARRVPLLAGSSFRAAVRLLLPVGAAAAGVSHLVGCVAFDLASEAALPA